MNSAIIVAAGKGTRMGPNIDKLFLEAAGRPVIAHTWANFEACDGIDEIVLVVRAGMERSFQEMAERYGFRKPVRFAIGGAERQDSVWNGLEALSAASELVAIQDGARPCGASQLIEATLEAARRTGAAVAAQRVTDTIKESRDGRTICGHLDRSRLWAVQTPQTFRVEVIRKALGRVREKGLAVTDDTAACELIGQAVEIVESTLPNPKVTVPSDLPFIELLLARGS
ncbi:MAG TPA: 2-C-methyl-D-erythritol 4-phosphate cytidylyltransferase [Candidatus Saccharimonadales bacterium]|nr:2-C-methyl-D-erythritol 4-phosphate cytidylyltransferase [Candidatus Saccharimonadales bacterium]